MNMHELIESVEEARSLIINLSKLVESLALDNTAMRDDMTAMGIAHSAMEQQIIELRDQVGGKNRSAATKRNMTDADALRVLDGDVKDMGHKEAAGMVGLTYAQVYSARLAFTFKHVHRTLEKAGWVSKWSKG